MNYIYIYIIIYGFYTLGLTFSICILMEENYVLNFEKYKLDFKGHFGKNSRSHQ